MIYDKKILGKIMPQHKQILVGQCPMTDSYLQSCGPLLFLKTRRSAIGQFFTST